jgi:hypothetical protein
MKLEVRLQEGIGTVAGADSLWNPCGSLSRPTSGVELGLAPVVPFRTAPARHRHPETTGS